MSHHAVNEQAEERLDKAVTDLHETFAASGWPRCTGARTVSAMTISWLDPPTEPALRHLASFIDEVAHSVSHRPAGPVLRGGAWCDDQPTQLNLMTWLTPPTLRYTLENAVFDASCSQLAAELSVAVDHLTLLAAASPGTSPTSM